MSSKRSMSWPRSSHQEPEDTKKKNKKRNENLIPDLEEFVMVRKANIILRRDAILKRDGYELLTGLPKGVTQEQFDQANQDYRDKKKSETACSEVECQPVTID